MAQTQNRPVAGVIWMLVTGVMFVAVTAIVKYVGSELPAAEAAFLRYLLGLVFLIPMIGPIRRAKLTPRALKLFGFRGVVHTLGVTLWFYAMTQISIAEVTAMNYLAPVYVTIGAAFFLGEKLALRRILAVVAALVGAMVILRPGFRELSPGHFAMLITAVMFAGSYLTAKVMADEVSPAVVVGMLSITVTIGLAPLAAMVWVTPTLEQLGWMFLLACFATAGHYSMTLAFQAAPVTVTQPVTFLQLFWAVLLGALVFDEAIDGWVIFGGLIILAAVSFITWREAMLKRATTPPVPATKV
ncbi:EamA-like transporter family protein [Litoreibacter ascidiaceicola]|uniref:EamA-like transporter family protein n=1 Tax=Litoreibacter ascidiaceicola TaxID=1486859 RepID=A0A1M5EPK3_9RHOB|nr:DMT family transporter [Litoreibacter ascidiaceicola]SHF80962.1 EamA-like transporter family protein [Litoreibacter ascidiaceicola]